MDILVVDDALFLRKILRDILTRNGFNVIGEATDGQDAVEKYIELRPDIVTMDITMPRLNGIDAMKQILQKHPEAKVIMCSAMGREDFQKEALDAGAVDFITKPFVEENIVDTIKQHIG